MMQDMIKKLKIEKPKMEKTLKKRDERLRQKDRELKIGEREHEKLQYELKMLWKLKEKRKYWPEIEAILGARVNGMRLRRRMQRLKRPHSSWVQNGRVRGRSLMRRRIKLFTPKRFRWS